MPVCDLADIVEKIDHLAGTHIGTVVDNNDPEKRCRVRVMLPIFSGLPTQALPWASVMMPTSIGGSVKGAFAIPEINTQVAIVFPNNDVNTPLVTGFIHTPYTAKPQFDADYPNSYGFVDADGLTTAINKTQHTVDITHFSGTKITIDAIGNVTITNPANLSINSGGTCTIQSGGNMKLIAPRIDLN